ncbi:MAG: SLBB domain-containing protein [Ignavibacteriaceae bacterium]
MRTKILIPLFLITFCSIVNAQDDIQIGSGTSNRLNAAGALFDYSDPSAVNIKVQLWGYVKFPGYYIVPLGSSLNELISLAGGPNEDALLDDIRVTKIKEGTQTSITRYNYNDLMWNDDLETSIVYTRLDAGDIIVVPGEPRYFLRQDVSFYLSVVTALASLAALIISITNN